MTLKERYGEIKDIAGQSAVNRGSLAGKMAKQAAALSNNSKMTQALLSSQAMNDAVAQGYDEGVDKASNIASQVAAEEAREKEREQNQKQFEAQQKLEREERAKDRKLQKSEGKKERRQGLINAAVGAAFKGFGWGD